MNSTRIIYEGNVQGVGFRYSVKQIAHGFDVTGWIQNLRDGRVEMQANGDEEEVRAFLEAVMKSELRGHIRAHQETPQAEAEHTSGFQIRHE